MRPKTSFEGRIPVLIVLKFISIFLNYIYIYKQIIFQKNFTIPTFFYIYKSNLTRWLNNYKSIKCMIEMWQHPKLLEKNIMIRIVIPIIISRSTPKMNSGA